jgi:hypothetical protein
MTYTVTYSADLVRNFRQDDIVAPESKFQALEGNDGASLLFSVGTDDVMYATPELPGSRSGWGRSDISTAILTRDFAGVAGARVRDFATAQRAAGTGAAIHLAMVITDGRNDHLYLSMNNPNTGQDWATTQPAWRSYPFDDETTKLAQLMIAGVFISEATDQEYIVVDIVRNPSDPQPLIARYYIDPTETGGPAWQQHDVAIDLSAIGYVSCLGRKSGEGFDGLYTAGQVTGSPQLQYQPMYNAYGSGPAKASRYKLPGGLVADNIAATRNADNTSDLYVTAQDGLYYLGSRSQQDNATATLLFANPLFTGMRSLFAAAVPSGGVIVWGLNGANQVLYTSCATSNPATGQWSVPLPIMTAEQVSPYLDRGGDANTFFAHTGAGQLAKSVKSQDTTMWTSRQITLPPPQTTTPARNFSSYTTTIRVTDETGAPVDGAEVTLQAANNTRAYINYLYYVLGSAPITVAADSDGTVTIIEAADGLTGTRLNIRVGGADVDINPMDTAFRTAASLDTSDKLMDAQVQDQNGTVQGPLVPAGTSQDGVQAAADGNVQLGNAYGQQAAIGLIDSGRASRARRTAAARADRVPGHGAHAPAVELPGGLTSILVEAGDLFLSLTAQAVKTLAQVVYDEGSKLYAFVAQINGQLFHCLLDCVEAIATSAWHLLTMIIDEIEDIIKFLEFLFEWKDIVRTKDVVYNIMLRGATYLLGQFGVAQQDFDTLLAEAEQQISDWSGQDWSVLGPQASQTPSSTSGGAPAQTSPSSMVSHHYQNNAQNATQPTPDDLDSDVPFDQILAAIEAEAATLIEAISALVDLASDLPDLPLDQLLTRMVGILAETLTDSARNLVDAAMGIVTDLADAFLKLFQQPIHIPVVSDILEYFGIGPFSFLDIAAWLTAVPATLLYKVIHDAAPFPDNAFTAELISAPDFPTLVQLVTGQPLRGPGLAAAPALAGAAPGSSVIPSDDDIPVLEGMHCLAFAANLGLGITSSRSVMLPDGSLVGKLNTCFSIVGGGANGIASYATTKLVPDNAIQNKFMSGYNDVLTVLRMIYGVVFGLASLVQPTFDEPYEFEGLVLRDVRAIGATYDAGLAFLALTPSIFHFVELGFADSDAGRTAAIVDETSNLVSILGRICYCAALTGPDPEGPAEAPPTAAVLLLLVNWVSALLQLCGAFIL